MFSKGKAPKVWRSKGKAEPASFRHCAAENSNGEVEQCAVWYGKEKHMKIIETDGLQFIERDVELSEQAKLKIKVLQDKLEVLEDMRKEYEQKLEKAKANAWDTGSTSSYNTMHKYEGRLGVLKHAENDICAQIAQWRRP